MRVVATYRVEARGQVMVECSSDDPVGVVANTIERNIIRTVMQDVERGQRGLHYDITIQEVDG